MSNVYTRTEADLLSGVINVKNPLYAGGAKGDNSTDDYAAINAAIAALPAGGVLFFPPGQYLTTQKLVLPSNCSVYMSFGNWWPSYGGTPCYLKPKFGSFQDTTLISIPDGTNGVHILQLSLASGRATQVTTGNPVNGITITGKVKGLAVSGLLSIDNFSGYGVSTDTTANGWLGGVQIPREFLNLTRNALGGWKSANSASQSWAISDGNIGGESGANNGPGWEFDGAAALNADLCATFNTSSGIVLSGLCGTINMTVQTDRNYGRGIYSTASEATSATNTAPHMLTIRGVLGRDGRNDDVNHVGMSAIELAGTSTSIPHIPTKIDVQIKPGQDDGGGGIITPDYGVKVTNGPIGQIQIVGSNITASTAPLSEDVTGTIVGAANVFNKIDPSTGALTRNLTAAAAGAPFANGRPIDFQPYDHGMVAWAYDVALALNSSALSTAGVLYLVRVHVPVTTVVTNILQQVITGGSGLTSGQCFAGIYQNGTLLGSTADQSTNWASTGQKTMALTSPVTVAPGDALVAFLFNGTTGPTLMRGSVAGGVNFGLTGSTSRFATAGTGQTSLPSTLPTMTALGNSYWVGLS